MHLFPLWIFDFAVHLSTFDWWTWILVRQSLVSFYSPFILCSHPFESLTKVTLLQICVERKRDETDKDIIFVHFLMIPKIILLKYLLRISSLIITWRYIFFKTMPMKREKNIFFLTVSDTFTSECKNSRNRDIQRDTTWKPPYKWSIFDELVWTTLNTQSHTPTNNERSTRDILLFLRITQIPINDKYAPHTIVLVSRYTLEVIPKSSASDVPQRIYLYVL